jgi:hypothetical protein
LGCAGDVDRGIEGDGDIDSRTDTVAAVRGGGGDSSNFGGSVEQDGDVVAASSPQLSQVLPVAVDVADADGAGAVPVVKSTLVAKVGVVASVAVVLSRMEALALPVFATAKSGFPSPLMSPMLTE